jgi:hypothetical protein
MMTDPYNSYPSNLAPPKSSAPAETNPQITARPKIDHIARLDVSEKWKRIFRAVDKAGGPKLPRIRELPFGERFRITSNFLAFFFWPIYLPVKGLWRQAVVYFLIGMALVLLLELTGLGRLGRGVGYGLAAVAMMRANVGYYMKTVLGEAPWA